MSTHVFALPAGRPAALDVRSLKRRWADLSAPTLVLLAPILSFVSHHGYGFLRPEILWIWALVLVLGLTASALVRVGGSLGRVVVLSSLVGLFVHTQLGWGLKLVGPGVLLLGWLLRAHLAEIVAVSFFALAASSLVIGAESPVRALPANAGDAPLRTDLPPIVHLVLDEHIGVEGIPPDIQQGRDVAEELKDFYRANGFRLFGRAFSHYDQTYNSIPNLFNFTALDTDNPYLEEKDGGPPLAENAYFRLLSERGYQLRVYQATYLEYCPNPEATIEACIRYSPNSIKSIEDVALAPLEKVRFVLQSFLTSSPIVVKRAKSLFVAYGWLRERVLRIGIELPTWVEPLRPNGVGPIAVREILERVKRDIGNGPAGRVFFAHLLIPHYPYVYDAECHVWPQVSQWLARSDPAVVRPRRNTADSRALRYQRYLEQVRCQQRLIGELFEALRATGAYEDAIIVVHGDHGSRIRRYPLEEQHRKRLSSEDYIASFSTLFAVKAPGVEPGYDETTVPIESLLSSVFRATPIAEGSREIYLRAVDDGPLIREQLPRFGAAVVEASSPR